MLKTLRENQGFVNTTTTLKVRKELTNRVNDEAEIERELTNVEQEIKELKKTSLLSINKIATEITNDLLKKIMGTNSNMSSVSAIVEDISKREVEKNL